MGNKCVLVIDSESARLEEMAGKLRRLNYNTLVANDGLVALSLIESKEPDLVLCDWAVTGHSAKELREFLHEFVSEHIPFVLAIPEDASNPEEHRHNAGADALITYPIPEPLLARLCKLLLSTGDLKARLRFLEAENAQLRRGLSNSQVIDPETKFYRLDFFKHVILIELKKAQRHEYPLSLLLLAFDRYSEMSGWLTPEQRRSLFRSLRREIGDSIRDIDIPLLFAAGKILVVMPHTGLEGAVTVADRIRSRVAVIKPPPSIARLHVSASVAVASTEGIEAASFGKLVKETMQGLKEAEVKGGDVVIVHRHPGAALKPGPDLASKLGPRTYFL